MSLASYICSILSTSQNTFLGPNCIYQFFDPNCVYQLLDPNYIYHMNAVLDFTAIIQPSTQLSHLICTFFVPFCTT